MLYTDKPSASLTPAPAFKAPGILSRAEILRRRQESERPRVVPVAAPVVAAPMVEMHVADMTPIPKNKGGRPRKV